MEEESEGTGGGRGRGMGRGGGGGGPREEEKEGEENAATKEREGKEGVSRAARRAARRSGPPLRLIRRDGKSGRRCLDISCTITTTLVTMATTNGR